MVSKLIRRSKGEAAQLSFMLLISIATQIISLYKSTVTASSFGASIEMDAYNFTNNITTFLFSFVASGVTTVVIPAYVQKKRKEDINAFLTLIYSVVFIGTALLFVFRRPVFSLLTNRGVDFVQLASEMMIFTIVIQSVTAVLAITTAFYQCENRFNTPKMVVFFCNVLTVILLIIEKNLTIHRYLWILAIAAVINLSVDVFIAIKLGFRYTPSIRFQTKGFKKLLKTFIPCMFSTGVYKIHSLVDSLIASTLGDGQLTILSYANMIVNLVNTLIVNNLTVYAYPKLVSRINGKDERNSQEQLWRYCILFQLVVCLMIAGFVSVGKEGIALLFLHGKFDAKSADMMFICCSLYILGQENNIVRDLIYRYFFAKADTKTTFANSVFISIINLVLSIILVQFIGLYGIIIGTIVSGFISLIMIIIKLRKRYGLYNEFGMFVREYIKNNCIMFVTIGTVYFIKHWFAFKFAILNIAVFGMLTVAIFAILTMLLKSVALKTEL